MRRSISKKADVSKEDTAQDAGRRFDQFNLHKLEVHFSSGGVTAEGAVPSRHCQPQKRIRTSLGSSLEKQGNKKLSNTKNANHGKRYQHHEIIL